MARLWPQFSIPNHNFRSVHISIQSSWRFQSSVSDHHTSCQQPPSYVLTKPATTYSSCWRRSSMSRLATRGLWSTTRTTVVASSRCSCRFSRACMGCSTSMLTSRPVNWQPSLPQPSLTEYNITTDTNQGSYQNLQILPKEKPTKFGHIGMLLIGQF